MNDPIVIVSAVRTPMGAFQGVFGSLTAPQLGAVAIKTAVERAGVAPELVEEVLFGCVLPAGLGQAPVRQAALPNFLSRTSACFAKSASQRETVSSHRRPSWRSASRTRSASDNFWRIELSEAKSERRRSKSRIRAWRSSIHPSICRSAVSASGSGEMRM